MLKIEFKNGYTTIFGSIQSVKKHLENCSHSTSVHCLTLAVVRYMTARGGRMRNIESKNYKITVM
jgi:hypothetical protein